jgi:hypothetical protein
MLPRTQLEVKKESGKRTPPPAGPPDPTLCPPSRDLSVTGRTSSTVQQAAPSSLRACRLRPLSLAASRDARLSATCSRRQPARFARGSACGLDGAPRAADGQASGGQRLSARTVPVMQKVGTKIGAVGPIRDGRKKFRLATSHGVLANVDRSHSSRVQVSEGDRQALRSLAARRLPSHQPRRPSCDEVVQSPPMPNCRR